MASVNKVILLGNLTRDPEVRYTSKGLAVADFGLAVNRCYTSDSGEKREESTFVDIRVWGKTAELARQYLTKGRQVYIEGRLQFETWDDKQTGQKRSKLRVVGETIQFLGASQEGQARRVPSAPHGAAGRPTRRAASPAATLPATADEDKHPF